MKTLNEKIVLLGLAMIMCISCYLIGVKTGMTIAAPHLFDTNNEDINNESSEIVESSTPTITKSWK